MHSLRNYQQNIVINKNITWTIGTFIVFRAFVKVVVLVTVVCKSLENTNKAGYVFENKKLKTYYLKSQ